MTLLTSDQDTFEQPQDDEVVLSVKNVSKRFCRDLKRSLFYGIQDIGGEVFGARRKDVALRKGEFWALNDVSFELRRGEALGLVGANGAGKTTLLRIISGLIKPDHGSVEIKGRVAPLIALGAGFNPILTGRENIYVNMSILGLSKEEIDERFDQVVEFAEIGEAIDAPVQSYSSGMAARLGFASAIHTEPDILLIDEVLSVGDIKFRAKCHRRLSNLRDKGVSFVLVSHNTQAIFTACTHAVYLRKGEVIDSGSVNHVIRQYEQDIFSLKQNIQCHNFWEINQTENILEDLGIISISFQNSLGEIISPVKTGEEVQVCVKLYAKKLINKISAYILITQESGENDVMLSIDSGNEGFFMKAPLGISILKMTIPQLCLCPGNYIMKVIIKHNKISVIDYADNLPFVVESYFCMNRSLFYQPHAWELVR
ncbi:polysaccharide ABC transporter ATP-binding protein [Nodularia chucula]|uniref:ABC transporter ATP-binding protein n=1 Tax=Nodularia chucula TaxID=3093667 RepID=UPI0039C726D4